MAGTAEADRALALADEAFARFDVDAVVAHLSAAIRGFTAAGATRPAAMACARLGDTYANAIGNVTAARAWFARARRLLHDEPPCIEQGWVAVAAMGCDVDDPAELLAAAELALERARRFGDVNLEAKALADAGLAHVQAGRLAEGMALLDEAMALVCGPADDVDVAGKSVCSFFTACYYAADFGRAGSWTDLLRAHGLIGTAAGAPVFLANHCDSVQATALVELGRWSEAEALLLKASHDFESAMAMPSWHSAIALADLRVRQGRLAEAEALLLGKEQHIQALLPAARLHLARGEHDLARATATRGLRLMAEDRPRAVDLLTVVVDAELARGDLDAAQRACAGMTDRLTGLGIPLLQGRVAAAQGRVHAASGDLDAAIAVLESAADRLDARQLPWLRATLLLELGRHRLAGGEETAAALDVASAASILATLDVVLSPDDRVLLERFRAGARGATAPAAATATATLARQARRWLVAAGGSSVQLPDSKGLRYLAELVASAGVERHALDLVDRIEGVEVGGVDRRAIGDAGEVLDAPARAAYRRRIEALRADIDDALETGRLETAEALQEELDQLVGQLAQAFGLGGRGRPVASAAERARLNVTRALRAAISRITEALPDAGAALDRGVQTGLYCIYRPGRGDVRWIVQPALNEPDAG
jgi:tetratricopeptide (TPR) repeat protein